MVRFLVFCKGIANRAQRPRLLYPKPLRFDIVTIFPKIFDSYFHESILKRAQERKLIEIKAHDLRDFSNDRRRTVDRKPYGGGAGMVLMAGPILKAVDSIRKRKNTKVVVLSAKGKQFNQKIAHNWAKKRKQIIFVSGRYEGIDERIKTILKAEEISIGPYVLTDGEVAAMAIISAVARLLPGVIRMESLREESHFKLLTKREKDVVGKGSLEYPHYTRPEVFKYKSKKYSVPKVLLSGDHKKISAWRESHRKILSADY